MWGFCPCCNCPWARWETLDIQQVMFSDERTEQFLLSLKATYFSYLISETKWGGADTSRNSRLPHQYGSRSPFKVSNKLWVWEVLFCFLILSLVQEPAVTCHVSSSLILCLHWGQAKYYLLLVSNQLHCCSCNQNKCKASNSSCQHFFTHVALI